MKYLIVFLAALCLVANAQASQLAHLDFAYKNLPYTTWDYEDITANTYNGTEGGTWYHVDGRTDANADVWDDVGGARGGVFADRTAYEVQYDIDHSGNPNNQRVFLDGRPIIAADAGITLAAWVNPEEIHARGNNPDPKFAHVIALGAYGDNPIATLEISQPSVGQKRVHGWIEGNGADTQYEITGLGNIAANAWTHIAITYDRVNNQAKTYINGILDNTIAIPGVGDGILDFTGMYFQIGGGIATHHDATFLGMIDDVMVYDEALTEAQIQAIVPEPATLALLGLGGLLGLRRRK
ncbi:MAG: LamG domain-containing protein [Sedimentisphaerales bacterium]|nr:LamG domain-containing protein [Sedimentisphaerales bacterium]